MLGASFLKSLKGGFKPAQVKGGSVGGKINEETPTVKKREPVQAASARKFSHQAVQRGTTPTNKMKFGKSRMFGRA